MAQRAGKRGAGQRERQTDRHTDRHFQPLYPHDRSQGGRGLGGPLGMLLMCQPQEQTQLEISPMWLQAGDPISAPSQPSRLQNEADASQVSCKA